MSHLNVGVVGLGWVAGAHIETFKSVQGARVTAVCSRRELKEFTDQMRANARARDLLPAAESLGRAPG